MFVGELRPFQVEGVRRMVDGERLLLGAVMGTGKTVMTIAAIEELIESGEVESGLIICPSSLKYQWMERIHEFTDHAEVVLIDGTPTKRARQYKTYARVGEYAIMNYEQVVNDWDLVKNLPMDFIVCDEVQAIKNFKPKRSKQVKKLQPRYRFGLSGQPVENRPEEVFSIFEWIDGGLFGKFGTFDRTFIKRDHWGGVERYINLDLFHEVLSRSMFRVSYDDIKDQLPKVRSETRTVPFDAATKRLWKVMAQELLTDLENMGGGSFDLEAHYGKGEESGFDLAQRGRLMAKVTCLKMLGDHPELLTLSAERMLDETDDRGSQYAADLAERGLLTGNLTPKKYTTTLDLIQELVAEGHKVVLFSVFKDVLAWFQKDLAEHDIESVTYHGEMSAKAKNEAAKHFSTHDPCKVFLASDAGGTGLDLPVASALINYNLPWSAGQLAQRNARIRRISSTHPHVLVFNMLSQDSIDVRQYEMLKKKNEVADAVTDGKMDDSNMVLMDTGTLKDFITATLKER